MLKEYVVDGANLQWATVVSDTGAQFPTLSIWMALMGGPTASALGLVKEGEWSPTITWAPSSNSYCQAPCSSLPFAWRRRLSTTPTTT